MRQYNSKQKKQRHRILCGVVPLLCTFILSAIVAFFFWKTNETQQVYEYWIAARLSTPFDETSVGKELERQCDCHIFLRVRGEREVIETFSRVDVLLYIKSTRTFTLQPGSLALFSSQSVVWGQNLVPQCFKNTFFNPACGTAQNNNNTATTVNGTAINNNETSVNGTVVNNGTVTNNDTVVNSTDTNTTSSVDDSNGSTDVVVQDRKLIYSGLDAQKSSACAEEYHEEILLYFVLMDNVLNSETWSIEEFSMHAGCYNTGYDETHGTRANPHVFKNQVCQGFPSALLTVTIADDASYNILLSAETLILPSLAHSDRDVT